MSAMMLKNTLKAVVLKAIKWDNCEGLFVTMASVGRVIDVTYHKSDKSHPNSNYSAHFDMGDWICSDYVNNDQIRIISEEEAKKIDEQYKKEFKRKLELARMQQEEYEYSDNYYADQFEDKFYYSIDSDHF